MNGTAKGVFIVLDGTDGSGKATQTDALRERLTEEGRDVAVFDFPRYGKPSAFFVERYLRGEYGPPDDVGPYRGSLFFALDRFDASPEIRAALSRGAVVLSNRYVSANKGHQTALMKTEEERTRFLEWLNRLEYDILGIPVPDLTIFLHVPADVGYALVAKKEKRGYLNGKERDVLEENREHLRAAEQAYISLAKKDTRERWTTIECAPDGNLLPVGEINTRVWDVVKQTIPPL